MKKITLIILLFGFANSGSTRQLYLTMLKKIGLDEYRYWLVLHSVIMDIANGRNIYCQRESLPIYSYR